MTRISPRHPRYESLRTRSRLAKASRGGVVVPEGLIAHGRGEAFDYFLGERTIPSARNAERLAARWLIAARHPVLSVNGNVAALAARAVAALQRARPGLDIEVNLFHRTPGRSRAIGALLRKAGVDRILGLHPTANLPGLPSDRARVDRRGILRADLCVVPLEDGDRALALHRMGKRVIAIDLNPMSRTSETADLPIVDELRPSARGHHEGRPSDGSPPERGCSNPSTRAGSSPTHGARWRGGSYEGAGSGARAGRPHELLCDLFEEAGIGGVERLHHRPVDVDLPDDLPAVLDRHDDLRASIGEAREVVGTRANVVDEDRRILTRREAAEPLPTGIVDVLGRAGPPPIPRAGALFRRSR